MICSECNIRSRIGTKALVCLVAISVAIMVSCKGPSVSTSVSPLVTISTPASIISPLDSPTGGSSDEEPTASPQVVPDPSVAAMTGQIISTPTSQPVANTLVRLAKVFWDEQHKDGAYVLNTANSPTTLTDDNGFFVFENLEPADYVMVIGEMPRDHIVSNSDGSAKVVMTERGKVADVGKIFVAFSTEGP